MEDNTTTNTTPANRETDAEPTKDREDVQPAAPEAGDAAAASGEVTDSEQQRLLEEEFGEKYESMEELYEESFRNVVEGKVVRGKVLEITDNEVLVDVGYKSEGAIPLREFHSYLEEHDLKVGDEVDVYLESAEDADGLVVLSKEKADKIKIWDEINNAYERGEILEGRVIERIKGGLTVDIGVRAFLPGSQVDLRPVRNPESLIGKTLKMKVIKLNKRRGNIVLSRRVILEDEREDLKRQTIARLQEGTLVKGTVKNITEYGAFIDLGGIDGLLHITDMSWGRVNHPSELFVIGDEVEIVVLKFDREKEKVSLGLKQKTPDPWETADVKYPVGSRVRGKVISITDYGAFVELEEGIEGLVHISEMSWTRRVRHPSKIVAIGDTIDAVVLDLDKNGKRISLGMKQIEPNPWQIVKEKYQPGTRVTGRVRNLTNFGAFVELEEGIDGLIHISDMSWTSRISHPSEVLRKGEQVEVVILEVDAENERLSLGLKQLRPDPWSLASDKYRVGQTVEGKIVRLSEFGAFVELEEGVEGLVHISEIDTEHVARPEDVLTVDEVHAMRIIKVDARERKIGLSIRAVKEGGEKGAEAPGAVLEVQDSVFANKVLDGSLMADLGFGKEDEPESEPAAEEPSATEETPSETQEATAAEPAPADESAAEPVAVTEEAEAAAEPAEPEATEPEAPTQEESEEAGSEPAAVTEEADTAAEPAEPEATEPEAPTQEESSTDEPPAAEESEEAGTEPAAVTEEADTAAEPAEPEAAEPEAPTEEEPSTDEPPAAEESEEASTEPTAEEGGAEEPTTDSPDDDESDGESTPSPSA